jgi:hypothetical protein
LKQEQAVIRKAGSGGTAVQRGLEPGSRGIAIVRSRYRQLLVKTLQAGKVLK